MPTITKKKTQSKVQEILSKPYKLILHNDDYNSFSHVIESLIKICKHDHIQAEQCANIVHFNGKCDVKYGDYETISDMLDKLRNLGLCATMDSN
jgi:ATP-dependent Clp protease adaptor protein ClpS